MSDNVYFKENEDWQNKIKYGYVNGGPKNLVNRLSDSSEHSERSEFINIYTFKKTDSYMLSNNIKQIDKIISKYCCDIKKLEIIEDIYNIKLPLMHELNKHLVKSKTKCDNEFVYKDGIPLLIRVLKEEFPKLGLELVKEYSPEKIQEINTASVVRERKQLEQEYKELMELKALSRKPGCDGGGRKMRLKDETKWFEREYQRTIIKYGLETLLKLHKFYLELATGGGKSYIIYKILSQIKPDTIVIFSPRKNINKQNCSDKYLSLLNDEYLVYNCSKSIHFDKFKKECSKQNKKMMIVACPQKSHEKVYDIIQEHNLNNIFIWFDEAHNTIEKWVNKIEDRYVNFFLCDNERINNRIFTSASPDKKHVETHTEIFGELYSPIKVKELIHLKWLCPIIPHIFSMDKNNIHICNYNLEHFEKFNCTFGFSFHNIRESAFNLFQEHYRTFMQCDTTVKPFLLLGDDYENPQLENIRENLKYDFDSIDEYEITENSMGYVVQQYSIGYDFKGIDYIIFSDPKMSSSDIIQCIGRGIRPDGLGTQGKNLNKKLSIMLPVYIESEIDTKFNRIEGILRYLIHDIDCEFENMDMNFNFNGNKKLLGEKYDGEENMKAILLDLLRGGKYSTWKPKEFITLLKSNNIHDREIHYNAFIDKRQELNLPDDPYRCFPEFTWEQTYDESPYYSKEECKQKIAEIKEYNEDLDFEEEDEPELYLNSIDPKIPPQCLFRFYGGHNNNEYY